MQVVVGPPAAGPYRLNSRNKMKGEQILHSPQAVGIKGVTSSCYIDGWPLMHVLSR